MARPATHRTGHGRAVPGLTAATATGHPLEPVTAPAGAQAAHTCPQQRRPVTTRTSPATQVSREPRAARPTNYPGTSSPSCIWPVPCGRLRPADSARYQVRIGVDRTFNNRFRMGGYVGCPLRRNGERASQRSCYRRGVAFHAVTIHLIESAITPG
jgi:hypothetical protein